MENTEKCVCHINGYAVKDAQARADIETLNTYTDNISYQMQVAYKDIANIEDDIALANEKIELCATKTDLSNAFNSLSQKIAENTNVLTSQQGAIQNMGNAILAIQEKLPYGDTVVVSQLSYLYPSDDAPYNSDGVHIYNVFVVPKGYNRVVYAHVKDSGEYMTNKVFSEGVEKYTTNGYGLTYYTGTDCDYFVNDYQKKGEYSIQYFDTLVVAKG